MVNISAVALIIDHPLFTKKAARSEQPFKLHSLNFIAS